MVNDVFSFFYVFFSDVAWLCSSPILSLFMSSSSFSSHAEAPQSLLFTAEVEVFNPNLLGGESEEGQVWLTYNDQRMGTGKMEPSKVSSQATAEIVTEMNLDLPLDFVPFQLWQELV